MSIIPASRLSRSDLNRLSHNIGKPRRRTLVSVDTPHRRLLAAVNRSLAGIGERVDRIDRAHADAQIHAALARVC